ncbi:hypothetical protein V6C49_11970 [Staphylococcus capitis subsp. capitis]|uniref:hypothetical protein n=1 Tax=Staphylococcus capitis TaxID=29388 RepID=UPI00345BF3AA
MESYQQFLNSPNTFIWIAFILYLISSLVFFSVTVFVGLRHVSLKERIITTFVLSIVFNTYVDYTYLLHRL